MIRSRQRQSTSLCQVFASDSDGWPVLNRGYLSYMKPRVSNKIKHCKWQFRNYKKDLIFIFWSNNLCFNFLNWFSYFLSLLWNNFFYLHTYPYEKSLLKKFINTWNSNVHLHESVIALIYFSNLFIFFFFLVYRIWVNLTNDKINSSVRMVRLVPLSKENFYLSTSSA